MSLFLTQCFPDPAALAAVTRVATGMARGGIYDQLGGGFAPGQARHATLPDGAQQSRRKQCRVGVGQVSISQYQGPQSPQPPRRDAARTIRS